MGGIFVSDGTAIAEATVHNMRFSNPVSFALAAGLVAGCVGSQSDETIILARLDGAIFTTLVDGSRVDANIYQAKTDVYLDGGPGNGAPQMAATLPDGDYYFMVTDPSGKTLLSSDAIECRRVQVEDGVIVQWYAVTGCTKKSCRRTTSIGCCIRSSTGKTRSSSAWSPTASSI